MSLVPEARQAHLARACCSKNVALSQAAASLQTRHGGAAACFPRIESFYRGREQEPHVRDIYQKLGDIYFDETEYPRAVEVYKRLLAKWPYAPDNPKVQDRVVLAFERMRDFNRALKE